LLDLKNKVKHVFEYSNDSDFPIRRTMDFKFILLEIKTDFPPTNIDITITDLNGNYKDFNLLENRKDFIFENGYYTLFLTV
jgi:hypothetical protein